MQFITNEKDLNLHQNCALYFYAQWMDFYKKFLIMIDKVEKKYKNIEFYAIDVDYFKPLCKRFKIASIPTVIILSELEEKDRIVGITLTKSFIYTFSKNLEKKK